MKMDGSECRPRLPQVSDRACIPAGIRTCDPLLRRFRSAAQIPDMACQTLSSAPPLISDAGRILLSIGNGLAPVGITASDGAAPCTTTTQGLHDTERLALVIGCPFQPPSSLARESHCCGCCWRHRRWGVGQSVLKGLGVPLGELSLLRGRTGSCHRSKVSSKASSLRRAARALPHRNGGVRRRRAPTETSKADNNRPKMRGRVSGE